MITGHVYENMQFTTLAKVLLFLAHFFTKWVSNIMFVSISNELVTFKNFLQHSTSALPRNELNSVLKF